MHCVHFVDYCITIQGIITKHSKYVTKYEDICLKYENVKREKSQTTIHSKKALSFHHNRRHS